MRSEEELFHQGDETGKTVKRFEEMRRRHKRYYFDVHEFEDIIDYYLGRNKTQSALEAVRCGLSLHPQSMIIQLKEAQVYLDHGRISKALKILKKLSSIENSNYEVFVSLGTAMNLSGQTDDAIKYYDRAMSLDPEDKDEIASQIGYLFQDREKYAEAAKYFRLAYKISPDRVNCLYELAYCYERLGKFDKSIQLYSMYLEKDPFSDHAWFNLGVVYNRMERFDKALEAYEYAIALNDRNGSALFNKASLLVTLRQYRKAIDMYHELLELEPNNTAAIIYLAECHEILEEYTKAELHYSQARKIDPDSAEAFFGSGILLLKQNKHQESRKYIRKAISLDEENSDYWYTLSKSYTAQNMFEKAFNAIKKTLEYDPFEPDYWLEAAKIKDANGALDEAIKILLDSFKFNPENAAIHYKLGIYYILNDKSKKSASHIEQGLILDYDLFFKAIKDHTWIAKDKSVQTLLDKYKKL